MSWLFASGGQSIEASASASVLPMDIQDWFPLGFTGLFPLGFTGLFPLGFTCCPRDSLESSPAPQFESINTSALSHLYDPTLSSVHDCWEHHSLDYMDFCHQSDVSVFNTLSRSVIAFLPRSKHLLISWLQSPSAVILEPKKIKSVTVSFLSPSICHEVINQSWVSIGRTDAEAETPVLWPPHV